MVLSALSRPGLVCVSRPWSRLSHGLSYSRVILKRNGEYIYKEVSFEGARPGGGVSAVIRAVKRRRARSYKYMMDSYLRTSKFDVDEREMPTEKKCGTVSVAVGVVAAS